MSENFFTQRPFPTFAFNESVECFLELLEPVICDCCQRETTLLYTGPIYCISPPRHLCPWCIADGTAAETYHAYFIDPDKIERTCHLAKDTHNLPTLISRTPGYYAQGWEQWRDCCSRLCTYVGHVHNWKDVVALGLVADWQESSRAKMESSPDLARKLPLYQIEHGKNRDNATVFVFRCNQCGTLRCCTDETQQELDYVDYVDFRTRFRITGIPIPHFNAMLPPVGANKEMDTTDKKELVICSCCDRPMPRAYTFSKYPHGYEPEQMCMDCIASGWAGKKTDYYTNRLELTEEPENLDDAIALFYNTPGIPYDHELYSDEENRFCCIWPVHCGRPAQLLGVVHDWDEVEEMGLLKELEDTLLRTPPIFAEEFPDAGLFDEPPDSDWCSYRWQLYRCIECGELILSMLTYRSY